MPFLSTTSLITMLMSSLEDSRMYSAMCYVVGLPIQTFELGGYVSQFPGFKFLETEKTIKKNAENK